MMKMFYVHKIVNGKVETVGKVMAENYEEATLLAIIIHGKDSWVI